MKTQRWRDLINLFLLSSIIIFSLIVFGGLSGAWVDNTYDQWRIFQIIILLCFGLYSILFRCKIFRINYFFILMVLLLIISCILAFSPARAFADFSLYFLLFNFGLVLIKINNESPQLFSKVAALLAVIPILTLIFLPLSVYDKFNGGYGDWYQGFSNIRMLDDALLPCLFMLWARPAWLAKNPLKSQLFNHSKSASIVLLSTLNLLSFWLNGSRAVLLSVFAGLLMVWLCKKSSFQMTRLALGSLALSFSVFLMIRYLTVQDSIKNVGVPLVRMDSSGRDVLWQKSINLWLNHPVFGIGGNNFSLYKPNGGVIANHPHDIPLQFLCEWGVAGIFIILAIGLLYQKIFKFRQQVPYYLFSGSIAVAINSLFSGTMIYPASQLFNIFLLSFTLSYVFKPNLNDNNVLLNKVYCYKLVCIFAIIIMLAIHGQDLFLLSYDAPEKWPRFWLNGAILH